MAQHRAGLRTNCGLCLLILLAACAGRLPATEIDFFDGTFASGWSYTVLENSSGNGEGGFAYRNGTDASGYYLNTYVNAETCSPWPSCTDIVELAVMSPFSYSPSSQGAIGTVTMYYDLDYSGGDSAQWNALMIFQNGTYYYAPGQGIQDGTWYNSPYFNFAAGSVAADDWILYSGSGPQHPDFTSSGGEIQFGYLAADTNGFSNVYVGGFGGDVITADSGGSAPEPFALPLAVGGLFALWAVRVRNRAAGPGGLWPDGGKTRERGE